MFGSDRGVQQPQILHGEKSQPQFLQRVQSELDIPICRHVRHGHDDSGRDRQRDQPEIYHPKHLSARSPALEKFPHLDRLLHARPLQHGLLLSGQAIGLEPLPVFPDLFSDVFYVPRQSVLGSAHGGDSLPLLVLSVLRQLGRETGPGGIK